MCADHGTTASVDSRTILHYCIDQTFMLNFGGSVQLLHAWGRPRKYERLVKTTTMWCFGVCEGSTICTHDNRNQYFKNNTTAAVVCYHTIVYHAMVYWSWLVPGGLMTVGGGAGFFRALPDILLSVDVFEGGGWCSVWVCMCVCVCVCRGGGGDSIANKDFTHVIELLQRRLEASN